MLLLQRTLCAARTFRGQVAATPRLRRGYFVDRSAPSANRRIYRQVGRRRRERRRVQEHVLSTQNASLEGAARRRGSRPGVIPSRRSSPTDRAASPSTTRSAASPSRLRAAARRAATAASGASSAWALCVFGLGSNVARRIVLFFYQLSRLFVASTRLPHVTNFGSLRLSCSPRSRFTLWLLVSIPCCSILPYAGTTNDN